MSYIRASTKVPGQRNQSRTYAFCDVEGGVVIWSRADSGLAVDMVGNVVVPVGAVRLSIPEMHYLCSNFIQRYAGLRGKALERRLAAEHREFYTRYDAKYEADFRQRKKRQNAQLNRFAKKHQLRLKKEIARLRKGGPSNAELAKRIEEEAVRELGRLEAVKRWRQGKRKNAR